MYPTCVLLSCLRDSGGIGLGMEIQLPGLVVLSICGTVVGQNTSDPCSRAESQPQPVLRQKQHGQQVNPGYCPTLLHTGETLSGALYPALGLPAQEGFGPVGASPEEDHRGDQRSRAPLLGRQATTSWDCSAWRRRRLCTLLHLLVPKEA